MHRSFVLLASLAAVASLTSLAPLARAGDETKDDFTWDPKAWKERKPEVGDRGFIETDRSRKTKTTISSGTNVLKEVAEDSQTTTRLVWEALAKDEKEEKITDQRIKLEKWKVAKKGAEPDTSLEGTTLRIKWSANDRGYTVEEGDASRLSAGAKDWIAEAFLKERGGGSKGDFLEQILPKERIAPGTEWTPEIGPVMEALFPGTDYDDSKSSAKGKLTNVRVEDGVHMGTVELKLSIQLKQFPNRSEVTWTKGGLLEVSVTMDGSLEPKKKELATTTTTVKLSGQGDMTTKGGDKVQVDLDTHTETKTRRGSLEKKAEK